MGMYTEIYINANLLPNTPSEVINVLKAVCEDRHSNLLDPFPARWRLLFNNGSYYTPLTSCSNLTFDSIAAQWSILGKGDIKNYNNEIEDFFDYVMPYIDAEEGMFIGYFRYEESPEPTLIFKSKEKYGEKV